MDLIASSPWSGRRWARTWWLATSIFLSWVLLLIIGMSNFSEIKRLIFEKIRLIIAVENLIDQNPV